MAFEPRTAPASHFLRNFIILFAFFGVGVTWWMLSYKAASRERHFCGEVKSDLANLSLAEDAYFKKHGVYFSASIAKGGTHPDIQEFIPSTYPHVSIVVEGGQVGGSQRYIAKGYSELCSEIRGAYYLWDSSKGGLQ